MIILFLEIFCFFFSHVTIIQTSSTGNIWTITRAYRTSKKPSKRGSMYILIVFLFSPPSLLIFIRLSSTWNTLTLYFYQPTTSRRWGTIHVIDLHPPARFFIAAARSCVHGTFHTDHRSICWTRSSLLRKKKKKNHEPILCHIHHWKKKNNMYTCKIVLLNWHYAHDNCCSCYRNLQLTSNNNNKKLYHVTQNP